MKAKHPSVLDFWSHVKVEQVDNPDSCWLWNWTVNHDGYGLYKSCLARRVAGIIYFHKIPGSITLRKECPNNCIRREHFVNVGWNEELSKKHHRQPSVVRKILAARTPAYTIKELCAKTGETTRTVRDVLRESAMYDILADVQRYLRNGDDIPILPDTRTDNYLIGSNDNLPNLELV
jgi:hypothetical protein